MYSNVEKHIMDICRCEYPNFLYKANVFGVGCGYKVIKGITTCELCIQVFVEKKVSIQCLDKNNMIPSLYKGVKTDVIETEMFRTASLTGRVRPVTGGYSIGPVNTDSAGSYAGLVSDDNNKLYMLSNNHVIAYSNALPIGTTILQPAPEDGGISPRDDVAKLSRFVPIKFVAPPIRLENYVDAAIAEVISPALFSRDTTYIGAPTGITTPRIGQKVQMVGSISEYLSGEVLSVNVSTFVRVDGNKLALFVEQTLTNIIPEVGDSGALFFDFNRKVLGLFFACNKNLALINSIANVLTLLNVHLVTGEELQGRQINRSKYYV